MIIKHSADRQGPAVHSATRPQGIRRSYCAGRAESSASKELFEKALRSRTLPIEIAEVRMAKDPLTATARGALIAALYEK